MRVTRLAPFLLLFFFLFVCLCFDVCSLISFFFNVLLSPSIPPPKRNTRSDGSRVFLFVFRHFLPGRHHPRPCPHFSWPFFFFLRFYLVLLPSDR